MRISSSARPGQPSCPGTQHYTRALPEDPSLRKSEFSQKSCWIETFHMNSTLLVNTHTLGLNIQLLKWFVPAEVRTLGNARRKIWFSKGSVLRQAAEIILFTWLFEQFTHTSSFTVPTDITNVIPGEQTLTLGVEHDTKQTEKQGVRLGTIRAWNGFELQELGILVPVF